MRAGLAAQRSARRTGEVVLCVPASDFFHKLVSDIAWVVAQFESWVVGQFGGLVENG